MPQIQWEDAPEKEVKTSGIQWEEPESDGLGLGAAFLAGINNGIFHMTGGSLFEHLLDAGPSNVLGLHAAQKGVDWLKDFTGVTYEPANSGERIAYRAAEDLSLGAASAAAMIYTGGATTAAPVAAKLGERVTASVVQAFKTNPMAASIYEMLGTGAAGGAM